MTVDRRADRALYLQLADVLRDDITAGRLGPGDRLPSETELIATHDISRGTVRDAIGILRSEGLVIVEHGRGAFARTTDEHLLRRTTTPTTKPLPFREAFEHDARTQGYKPTIRELDNPLAADSEVPPPVLDPSGHSKPVRTDLLCFIDGRPVQTATLWQSADSTSESTGITDELTARMPTRAERRLLQLDDGTPVIQLTRTLHRADGTPLEIARAVLVATRQVLTYTLGSKVTAE